MRAVFAAALVVLAGGAVSARQTVRFEKELAAFEELDRTSPPPKGQVVFVGSSTMVDWNAGASRLTRSSKVDRRSIGSSSA